MTACSVGELEATLRFCDLMSAKLKEAEAALAVITARFHFDGMTQSRKKVSRKARKRQRKAMR